MIPSSVFNLLVYRFDWAIIPASFTVTIGGITSESGVGLLGEGNLADVCALGTLATPTGVNDPVPTAKVLQGGVVGTAYSETISAQGGTAPYAFAVTLGALPPGMSLNGTTGVISGTPTTVATSDFTIQVTDAGGAVGPAVDFEIGVTAASAGAPTNYCIVG